jgi:hypothetical protein
VVAADERLAREALSVLAEPVVSVDDLPHAGRTTPTRAVLRVTAATKRAVVKVIANDPSDTRDPTDPYYAAREPSIYEHGLPPAFTAADIRAPQLLGTFARDTNETALWLEHVDGIHGGALTPTNYERIAHRLGRAQGTRQYPTTEIPWSRNFLPTYLATWDDVGWDRIFDDDAWRLPLMRAHFPADLRQELVRLCADRHEMLAWADRLPQTTCHHDVWLNNVFDHDDHTTLIDWAFAGTGAIGCDAGNLVTDSCGDLLLPTSMLEALDAAATEGYLAGLHDAQWQGTDDEARLGICLMAAKWSWLTPHMLRLAAHDTHRVYGQQEADTDHLFAERAAMLRYLTTLAAEARTRANQLGF